MDNAIYVALSRQLALTRNMDTIANNIANVDSVGFRSQNMAFREFLVDAGNREKVAFTQDYATVTNTAEGPIRHTGRSFDAAIRGKGFFQVETPLGPRFTRAGNFQLRSDGTITTAQGYPVLDSAGASLALAEEDTDIVIRENGLVTNQNGEERGQLAVVVFSDEQKLEHLPDSLFSSQETPLPADELTFRVVQGAVESSNVNAIREMTRMIEVSRSVGKTASLMKELHTMQGDALATIARER